MNRDQTFHERLIPLLVAGIGAQSYLELGTHLNETISKVVCDKRVGVDVNAVDHAGCIMLKMTTEQFFAENAAKLAPYDVCFIDATHELNAVRADFLAVMPFMSPEGLVMFHDSNPETMADTASGLCADSWKFAWGLSMAGMECLTLPFHPGLSIVRKRMSWGPQA